MSLPAAWRLVSKGTSNSLGLEGREPSLGNGADGFVGSGQETGSGQPWHDAGIPGHQLHFSQEVSEMLQDCFY